MSVDSREKPDSSVATITPRPWDSAYAYVFFFAIFTSHTVRYFVGSEPLVGAQTAQILVPLGAIVVSAFLWFFSSTPARRPSGLLAAFFLLLIFLWLWAMIRDWGAFDFTVFTLGPFLVLLALKPPPAASAVRILNSLGVYAVALSIVAAIFAVLTNVPPTGYTTKWPPFTDPFDPIGMWWAPFNGPAEAGAIGAVVIILGFSQRNVLTVPFIVGGGIILFYAGTLSAALGLGIALLVLLLGYARTSRHKRRIQVAAALVAAAGLVTLIDDLVRNPTVSSRTFIWSDFVALLQANPIWGWGTGQLILSEQTMLLPWGDPRIAHGSDAHNLLFDAWVRYGIFGFIAAILISVVALTVAYRGWKRGLLVGPALVVMSLAIGLTEHNIWWGAPGTAHAVLILGVLASVYGGGRDKERGFSLAASSEALR